MKIHILKQPVHLCCSMIYLRNVVDSTRFFPITTNDHFHSQLVFLTEPDSTIVWSKFLGQAYSFLIVTCHVEVMHQLSKVSL